MNPESTAAILEKLLAWEIAGLENARQSGVLEILDAGPFRIAIDPHDDQPESNFAILVESAATAEEITGGLRLVQETMESLGRSPSVELNAGQRLELPGLLESAGYVLEASHPLMTCLPGQLVDAPAEAVEVRFLRPSDPEELLESFLFIRSSGFDDVGILPEPGDIARFRGTLSRPAATFALGLLNGEPAGSGITHSIQGVAEMVGVATLPRSRRRGVGAAVSSALARRHFSNGGVLVFLDASGEPARRIYARLGFQSAGDRVSYRLAGNTLSSAD